MRHRRRRRGVQRAIDGEPVPLIVVGTPPVLRQVGRIDRRTEEELADVVHRLRQRVRHAVVTPPLRALRQRHVQRRGSSTRRPTSTGCCWRSWDSDGSHCCCPDATQRRHVLIHRHQQVAHLAGIGSPRAMVVRSPSCCSISILAWREIAFWSSRSIVVRLGSVTRRHRCRQDVREIPARRPVSATG